MPNQPIKGQLKRIAIQKGLEAVPQPKYKVGQLVWFVIGLTIVQAPILVVRNNFSEPLVYSVAVYSRPFYREEWLFLTLDELLDSLKQNAIPYKENIQ